MLTLRSQPVVVPSRMAVARKVHRIVSRFVACPGVCVSTFVMAERINVLTACQIGMLTGICTVLFMMRGVSILVQTFMARSALENLLSKTTFEVLYELVPTVLITSIVAMVVPPSKKRDALISTPRRNVQGV